MATDPEQQEVNLRTVLNSCSPENWQVARMWLLYTLFYWMFPTIIAIFGLWIARRQVKWLDLVIHGEFLIYAITIAAGSTRLVVKDLPKRGPFVNRQAFNLVSHVMIFPAIFTYGLLRYIGATSDPYSVSKPIVVTYSLALLVAAFGYSFIVFLIDAQRSTPDVLPKRVAAEIAHTPDKLASEFNNLQAQDKTVSTGSDAPGETTAPAERAEPAMPAAAQHSTDQRQQESAGDFEAPQDGK